MFDIKKFRKEHSLKQEQLANDLGYSRSTIANMESGRQPITDNFLDKIREIYGVDIEPYKSYNLNSKQEDWKEKYYAILEENRKLYERLTQCLEDKAALKDDHKLKVQFPDKPIKP